MRRLLRRISRVCMIAVIASALAAGCSGAPGGNPQLASPSLPTCKVWLASATGPGAECTSGRMVVPAAGFAISLADGWDVLLGADLGLFHMGGGVVWADNTGGASIEGSGSSISVSVYPQYLYGDLLAADPVGAVAESMMQGMSPETVRSEVDLPAGPAVRLDDVALEGGRNGIVWVVGGGVVAVESLGDKCEGQEAVFVVLAWFDDPAEVPVLEQMAQSLELLPRNQVVEAEDCYPAP